MKQLIVILMLASSTVFASNSSTYDCNFVKGLPEDIDQGKIVISGDPVEGNYESIKIAEKEHDFRVSSLNPVYIYLYEEAGKEGRSLEIVNPSESRDAFTLSVFKDFITMRFNMIARYKCQKASSK